MKKISEYLDMAKEVTGSDYSTANKLGITRQAISNARRSGQLAVDNCVELAKILDINPAEIVAASNIAKSPENRAIWGRWVAVFAILAVTAGYFEPINTEVSLTSSNYITIYYA